MVEFNLMNGIFASLREKNINVSDNSYFEFDTQIEHWKGGGWCYNSSIYGSPSYSLVDGDDTTAWANQDTSKEENAHISINFNQYQVYLKGYSLQTACYTPNGISVTGTNDGKNWFELDRINYRLPEN